MGTNELRYISCKYHPRLIGVGIGIGIEMVCGSRFDTDTDSEGMVFSTFCELVNFPGYLSAAGFKATKL